MRQFDFGKNWSSYLDEISTAHLETAVHAFQEFSDIRSLKGFRFLDIGCGSGIHSWAAYQLGANPIVSFDRDPDSVETCRRLKTTRAPDAPGWDILEGDILDHQFLSRLGLFDYVYAWGVLHHTGQMWPAIDHAAASVAERGHLHLAIYNRHWSSPLWKWIKWMYCQSPGRLQRAMFVIYKAWEDLKDLVRSSPVTNQEHRERGMTRDHDLRDWLGGYPYDYATAEEIQSYLCDRGFHCLKVKPNVGTGCSEFLFQRTPLGTDTSTMKFDTVAPQ